MASAHPTHSMLAAYAAGSATDGVSLLVAAHLTYCPACRARVAAFEALGASMLAATPETMAPPALDACLARLDAPEAPRARRAPPAPGGLALPRPVADLLGAPFAEIRWRFLMPGVAEHLLPVGAEGERVSLLRVRPGAGVPAHTHTGEEATLVLGGALCDRDRLFGVGDVAVATAQDDHHPTAGEGGDCVCLAVIGGGVRFTGAFARALNIFAE
jgi:putative transcriptional regulator